MLPPPKKKKKNFFFKFQKLRLKLKSVSKANTKPVLRSFQCHGAANRCARSQAFVESRKGVQNRGMRWTGDECREIKDSSNFQ